jgi:transposase
VGQHSSASASGLLGLDGFEVTAAEVTDEEWRLEVQTIAATVGCAACGTQARLHARRTVQVRDLPVGGRPVVLAWRKRIWRCVEPACAVQTWTEQRTAIRPRAVLTERARAEARAPAKSRFVPICPMNGGRGPVHATALVQAGS